MALSYTRRLALILLISIVLVFSTNTIASSESVEIPVLGYHHLVVKGPLATKSTMTAEKFRRDMLAIKKAGYQSITFEQLYDFTRYGTALPPKPIMVTFDDGYASNYELAYPILKATKTKATFFVIGWCVGKKAQPIPQKPHIGHFSWEEAREMEHSGWVEIESHTYDLHDIGGYSSGTGKLCGYGAARMHSENDFDYSHRIQKDFAHSTEDLTYEIKRKPLAIAYPFGRYDKTTELVSKEFFKGSFTVKPGVRAFSNPDDLYAIPRILVNEQTQVLSAIDHWERNPWEPMLTDLEADLMLWPKNLHADRVIIAPMK